MFFCLEIKYGNTISSIPEEVILEQEN
jgi:hypothetical protein